MSRWPRILLWLLLVKVVYLAAVSGALRLWGNMDVGMFQAVMQRWPREGGPVFASHFATWDGAHYLYLSEIGYARGVNSCAFYPLWPLLMRGGAVLTGGSHLVAGMILANVFSLAAWTLLYGLVARRFGEGAARWTLVLLIAFPGTLFAQFLYSEPVFLLLVALLWWGLEHGRQGWAAMAAVLLPLARPTGVFALLPIGWHLLREKPPAWVARTLVQVAWLRKLLWPADPAGHEIGDRAAAGGVSSDTSAVVPAVAGADMAETGTAKRDGSAASLTVSRWAWGDYALLLGPLIGWAAYLMLMWHWTGNPFEGFEAQKHWQVHSITNLVNVPKFVLALFTPDEWHAFRGSLLDRSLFVLLLYTFPVQWRLGKDLLVWTYVLGILPAMSGTFTSFTRYAATVFPQFIALAVFLSPEGREVRGNGAASASPSSPASRPLTLRALARWGLVAGFATLHLVLLWRFVNFRWAG